MYFVYYVEYYNFNPLPRKEGDSSYSQRTIFQEYFNPLPRKEGDMQSRVFANGYMNFNPLPRKEGDSSMLFIMVRFLQFQSTPS